MSSVQKVVVVFGATGAQGGSVARALLSDPSARQQFKVRTVTRNPSKPSAAALVDLGAEVIKADLEDRDSLRRALAGAYAVFVVTNFLEALDFAGETRQGKNAADIAKESGVKHFVWSSLPNVSKITNGKLTKAYHFDSKAAVDDHLEAIGLPHTIVRLGAYTTLLLQFLAPLGTTPPSYSLCFPEPVSPKTPFALIDTEADAGKYVKSILLKPEESIGRVYDLAEKIYTIEEIIQTYKNLGLNVVFQTQDKETYKGALASKGTPEFFQEDLLQVFQFATEYGFLDDVGESQKILDEPLTSLRESLEKSELFAKLKAGDQDIGPKAPFGN